MGEKDSEAVRRERVRQLWKARPPGEFRTPTGVLIFCKWLEDHYPELLTRGKGDPYQLLKADLEGLIE